MNHDDGCELFQAAQELAQQLEQGKRRIVFAESCTAGLVSATLAQVPGISQWHCGSAVVYREATKTAWLAIPPAMIEQHGVVSEEIAQLMAAGVLQFTPEAEISAAITGHLGPDAPPELDGLAHIATAIRNGKAAPSLSVSCAKLTASDRQSRQREAATLILQEATRLVESME